MKVSINYDLLKKIKETKSGISLKRTFKVSAILSLISLPIIAPITIKSSDYSFDKLLLNFIIKLSYYI